MKFALFGNTFQERKSASIRPLIHTLQERGATIYVDKAYYEFLQECGICDLVGLQLIEEEMPNVDIALSLGGDGTFLHTAARVSRAGIPILGINMGRLGFLATTQPEEIVNTLDEIYRGDYQVEERSTLLLKTDTSLLKTSTSGNASSCDDLPCATEAVALNEIAILKRDSSSMIGIRTNINDQPLTTYQADGLVISTPTGSTAYSLSNGGPIIAPQADTMCLTPVAPHSLYTRPIVIPDHWRLTLQVDSRSHNFLIALDGRNYTCSDDVTLTIQRGDYPVRVVKRPDEGFFHTLRRKLGWDADVRND